MPQSILKTNGPMLTSELAEQLVRKYAISEVAARKRIQRAKEACQIEILDKINFAHNQGFVFLTEQRGSRDLHEKLFDALAETNSILRHPLMAIRTRGGLIFDSMFPVYSGVPIKSELKLDSSGAKEKLLSSKLIVREGDYLYLALGGSCSSKSQRELKANVESENAFLSVFASWLKKQRLIGDRMTLRFAEEVPQACSFQWDFVAPSYVGPLATRFEGETKPGFIVCDTILGRKVSSKEVQFFLEKCSRIRMHLKHRPILAFLVCDWFEGDALQLAQANGVVFTTPKNLFGKAFGDALDEFREIYQAQQETLDAQALRIADLMQHVSKLENSEKWLENMRGFLFEMIVGHVFSRKNQGTVLFGEIFENFVEGKKFDCDILQVEMKGNLLGAECKAYISNTQVSLDDVKKWFSQVVPLIRKTYQIKDYPKQEFSIYTTGSFTEDALCWLRDFASKTRAYKVYWVDGEKMADMIRDLDDRAITKVFKKWFQKKKSENKGINQFTG